MVSMHESAVGSHVAVYWTMDSQYYFGQVDGYDRESNMHRILYEDNEWEFVYLPHEIIWFNNEERRDRKRGNETQEEPSKRAKLNTP